MTDTPESMTFYREPLEPLRVPAVGDILPVYANDGTTLLARSRVTAVDEATGTVTCVGVWIAPDHVWESVRAAEGTPE